MGLLTSERARRDGRVTFVQLVTSVVGFLLFSVMGGVLVAGLALPAVTVAGEAANGTADLFEALPEEFNQTALPQSSSIYAADGTTLLATFYTQNRVVVPLQDISPWMQKAQVDVEDKRFWLHHGVDGEGLLAAAKDNIGSESTRGASTITQQLVKNTLLQAAEAKKDSAERQQAIEDATETTLARKIREWRLALAYEEKLNAQYGTECSGDDPAVDCGKEQVLEQYLNIAQYGPSVYGVEAAAQLYFGIPAKELNAIQAATIAGITQNPTAWDPIRNPEDSQTRRNVVLQRMYEQKHITLAEYTVYKNTPIADTLNVTYVKASCSASDLAPFFCDYVTKYIADDNNFNGEGTDLLYTGGLKIVTTLDPAKQAAANKALRDGIPMADPSGLENALVSLDVATGNILAMGENRDFDPSSKLPNSTAINLAVTRAEGGSRGFSPGSSFKPIILATWLDQGHALKEVVSGTRRSYVTGDFTVCGQPYGLNRPWNPGNVEVSENRQTTVTDATAYSINTAYVAMAHELDLCDIRDMAEKLGFVRADGLEFEQVPSIALGTQNASPLTMASVYQTFANRGVHCTPRSITSITTLSGEPALYSDGTEVTAPDVSCSQVIRPEVADGVTYAMTKVFEYGTAKNFRLSVPAAGKTGTSQESKHLWFVGFTPSIVTAVWSGNAEVDQANFNSTINGKYRRGYWYGGDISGPIWQQYMLAATAGAPATGFTAPTSQILNGIQREVPDVAGLEPTVANETINDAGFRYAVSDQKIYRPDLPAGTIVQQTPEAGTMMTVGGTVTYYLSQQSYPSWWYNWPSGWDPLTAPSDWWGGAWPPADWTPNNPSNGWDPTPTVDPTPDPNPGGGGGGGNP